MLAKDFGDLDLAEESLQDAFAAAAERWALEVPANAPGWLYVTARRKGLDRLRRKAVANRGRQPFEAAETVEAEMARSGAMPDERLGLMFMCCHPALSSEAQVALTLRAVGGLTTPEIARLFITSQPTMAARLTRAKQKITDAGIPFREPEPAEWPERMAGVMAVVYLVFTQGYAPAVGDRLLREELCTRAIGLAETLLLVAPADPEVRGLLALMLIQHARRDARVGEDGQLTLLAAQDRGLWHGGEIARGLSLLSDISPEAAGPYQLQALIAAEHVNKLSAEMTNWKRIAALYERLEAIQPSPFVTLNRAVAVFEAEGPEAGLAVLESIGDGLDHHPGLHLARGEMLLRAGERTGARAGFIRALSLSQNAVEKAFLETRIEAAG
jgi:RNA polymerase sigma-70 factor, ECF subfamily